MTFLLEIINHTGRPILTFVAKKYKQSIKISIKDFSM
jgi:hypothetical protein